MTRRWEICAQIAEERIVAIVRAATAEQAVTQTRQLLRAGLRVAEVSLTTTDAIRALQTVVDEAPPDALIGAGTVLDAAAATAAIRAGASFLVCPTTSADVVRVAHRYGIPVLPAAATPTEAVHALELGADMVKIFPASTWTPASLADMLTALPQLPTVPTGGVTIEGAGQWISAGAVAVGVGSALTRGGDEHTHTAVTELRRALTTAAHP